MVFISASNKNYTIEENENVIASIISVAKNRFVVIHDVNPRDTAASTHTDRGDTNIVNRSIGENRYVRIGMWHIFR